MENQNNFTNEPTNGSNVQFNNTEPTYPSQTNYNSKHPIYNSLAGWMKFIGIYTIISGAITCIGIITAAIGVPLILSGIALTKASNDLKVYSSSDSPFILNEIFASLNKYFKTQGILIIVGIALMILYFAILIIAIGMGVNSFMQNY